MYHLLIPGVVALRQHQVQLQLQLQHQIQIQIQNQNQQQQQYLQQLQLELQLQQYGQQQQQQLQYQSIPLNQRPLRSLHQEQEQGKDPKKKSKFGYQKTLIVDPKNEDRLRKQREQWKKRKNKKTPEQIEEEAIEKSIYDKERLLNRTSEKIEQDVLYNHNTWINAPEELKERKRKTARDHQRRKQATINAAATATTTNDDENVNGNIQLEDDVSISLEVTAAGTTTVGCDSNRNDTMCTTAIDNNDPDYTIPTNGVAKNNGDDDENEQDEDEDKDKDEDDGDMSFDNNDDDDDDNDNGNDNNDETAAVAASNVVLSVGGVVVPVVPNILPTIPISATSTANEAAAAGNMRNSVAIMPVHETSSSSSSMMMRTVIGWWTSSWNRKSRE